MTIAGQRFGKHISEVTQSTAGGHPLLGSKSLGTYPAQRLDVASYERMKERITENRLR
jgi:hypothetical protein